MVGLKALAVVVPWIISSCASRAQAIIYGVYTKRVLIFTPETNYKSVVNTNMLANYRASNNFRQKSLRFSGQVN